MSSWHPVLRVVFAATPRGCRYLITLWNDMISRITYRKINQMHYLISFQKCPSWINPPILSAFAWVFRSPILNIWRWSCGLTKSFDMIERRTFSRLSSRSNARRWDVQRVRTGRITLVVGWWLADWASRMRANIRVLLRSQEIKSWAWSIQSKSPLLDLR